MLQLLIQGERKTDRMAFCKGKKRTHQILGVHENIWRWYACMRERKHQRCTSKNVTRLMNQATWAAAEKTLETTLKRNRLHLTLPAPISALIWLPQHNDGALKSKGNNPGKIERTGLGTESFSGSSANNRLWQKIKKITIICKKKKRINLLNNALKLLSLYDLYFFCP